VREIQCALDSPGRKFLLIFAMKGLKVSLFDQSMLPGGKTFYYLGIYWSVGRAAGTRNTWKQMSTGETFGRSAARIAELAAPPRDKYTGLLIQPQCFAEVA
jgi:hypothetical protein